MNHAAGKRCTVTGYGYMGEGYFHIIKTIDSINKIIKKIHQIAGPIPLRVREAELPVVSDAECIRKVNAVTEKIFILPASSFCAGGEEGNDACQGDGGTAKANSYFSMKSVQIANWNKNENLFNRWSVSLPRRWFL